ncbi:MAG: hypothetical protein RLZZ399_101 [Verrucomicrobiota bacterium]|jgi:thioredoxin-like negative regulator of GroEL
MPQQERISQLLHDANSLVARGELPQASNVFREIFEISPGHPQALRSLAEAMLSVHQHESALALLADSIDPDWPDVPTVLKISSILKNVQRHEEAADLLFASVHANPASAELRSEATALLSALGRASDLATLAGLSATPEAEAPAPVPEQVPA